MKKKIKKQAWWIRFIDGSIKKVFTENMKEAWKRGAEMGVPVAIAGSKSSVSGKHQIFSKTKKSMEAADPTHLMNLLKFIADPYASDPHAGDDSGSLIWKMQEAAKEALLIVENFPRVIIES